MGTCAIDLLGKAKAEIPAMPSTMEPQRVGYIDGADWVLPDGSVVAQAMELTNDEYIFIEDISEGDTLLFYADIDEYTIYLDALWGWADHDYYDDHDYTTTQLRSIPMLDLTTFLHHGITIKNCQNSYYGLNL